jgi:phosphoribosylformylglycinamidine cyclo-ligase
MGPLTYKQSGVDIEAADAATRRIAGLAKTTFRAEVLGEIGAFAGFVKVPTGYRDPVLVSSTDGVGSKLKVAFLADRHDTVGIDLVAMGVNDVLVHGAEPLFFLDYLALAKVVPEKVEIILTGVVEGCRQAGCALVGGETAELPDFYAPGEYDLAGFAVGVVERSRLVEGRGVAPGDRLLGLHSSGLHSNGYSLARKVVFELMGLKVGDVLPRVGRGVGEELLTPTRIYVKPVLSLLKALPVRAMAHITGGGLTGNLPRVLPDGCRAVIDRSAWPVPPIFSLIREHGQIAEDEMFKTFNMGVGLVIVVAPDHVEQARGLLASLGETVSIIGEIREGARGVEYAGGV